MHQKSIAIIGTRGYPSYYGGFETAVRKLAPDLVHRGWDVTVYGRKNATKADDSSFDPRVRRVETFGSETKSLSTLTYGFTAVLDAVRRKPDVALVMNVANGFWLPMLRLRRIPVIVNVDGIEWERAKWGRLAKLVFRLGAKATARFANTLISDSVEIKRRWFSDEGRESVFIPYGAEEVSTLPVPKNLQSRRYILLVARFVPENSVSEFLAAAEILAEDFDIVLVGSSGYGGEYDEKARELDQNFANVSWLGHVSDDQKLLALWQHAGVYFHGHSVGGTNPALVQAMMCGSPVVARDTVYNREVLGDSGVFVAPDVQAIIAACRKLMSAPDRQQELSRAAAERAQNHYAWPDVCAAYADLADRAVS